MTQMPACSFIERAGIVLLHVFLVDICTLLSLNRPPSGVVHMFSNQKTNFQIN